MRGAPWNEIRMCWISICGTDCSGFAISVLMSASISNLAAGFGASAGGVAGGVAGVAAGFAAGLAGVAGVADLSLPHAASNNREVITEQAIRFMRKRLAR